MKKFMLLSFATVLTIGVSVANTMRNGAEATKSRNLRTRTTTTVKEHKQKMEETPRLKEMGTTKEQVPNKVIKKKTETKRIEY